MGSLWHICVKVRELIDLLFGLVSEVGQGSGILDAGPHPQLPEVIPIHILASTAA